MTQMTEQEKVERAAREQAAHDPVSVCGHHCAHCKFTTWCGGCRSEFNICSFATLSEDGVCPQVQCSRERGLDGCYDCPELMDCQQGYYGVENEYVCKATALFIHRHGAKKYTETLERAMAAGVNYPADYDAQGSVDKALALLEKYNG